jgi:hypothetical protein
MLASMYPYATQANGEIGFSGTINFKVPKNSVLGGKNGMGIAVNFSQVNGLDKMAINDSTPVYTPGTLGYDASWPGFGKELYYQDFNIEVTKKFGKNWKGIFTYLYQSYNKDVVEGHLDEYGIIYSQIGVVDLTWNITHTYSLRGEFQGLWTKQDKQDWVAGLLEFTIAPGWFFSVQDQWNYGNNNTSQRMHFYLISASYVKNTSRIAVSYGRQREGIICVGGVCRYVPASNGLTLTLTTSF